MTKEFLLRQADTLLAQARRVRKSSAGELAPDRDRLLRHADEMEQRAALLEKQAVTAKTNVAGMLTGGLLGDMLKSVQTR